MEKMDDIELEVGNAGYPQMLRSGFLLLMKAKTQPRFISVLIGFNEAKAIIMETRHVEMKRPLAHDIFVQFCDRMGFHIREVRIYDYNEGIYYVKICVETGNETMQVESRFSDAVLIALKSSAPILMAHEIFDRCSCVESQLQKDQYIDDAFLHTMADIGGSELQKPELPSGTMPQTPHVNDLRILSTFQLQKLLNQAVADEKYERAQEINEELKRREKDGQQ